MGTGEHIYVLMVHGYMGMLAVLGEQDEALYLLGSGKDCTVKSDEDHVTMIPATIDCTCSPEKCSLTHSQTGSIR